MVLDDRYRVIQPIAQGGMGAVYLGEQIKLSRTVAIKFLQNFYLFDEGSRARFAREAKAMSKLSHPHCVSVIDFGVDELPYIVMDYVTGVSLDTLLHQEQMTFSRAIRIGLQILAGLAHAHGQGIIHRDIKPENVIIQDAAGTGDHVKIVDFSIAKMADQSSLSRDGAILGTPYYMSPEQAAAGVVDARTDLYSLGVVVFEMLTGQKPFDGESVPELLKMHRQDMPPSLGEVLPEMPFSVEIEAVIKKALAKSPHERFSSAIDFMRALAAVPEADDLGDISSDVYRIVGCNHADETVEVSPGETGGDERATKRAIPHRKILFGGLFAAAAVLVGVFSVVFESPKVALSKLLEERLEAPSSGSAEGAPGDEKDNIVAVKELIAAGRTDEAIAALQELRVTDPRSAEPAYLLGNLFSEKGWWPAALTRYENAVDLDPEYAKDPVLNRNLIRALKLQKITGIARKLIIEKIGENAIPHLREAIDEEGSIRVRRRAARLLEELTEEPSSSPAEL